MATVRQQQHPFLAGLHRPAAELDLLAEHKALMERFAATTKAAGPKDEPEALPKVKKEEPSNDDDEEEEDEQQSPMDLSSKKDVNRNDLVSPKEESNEK